MFGLILFAILVLVCIGAAIYLASYKEVEDAHYKKDTWGNYLKDENGNKIMVEASTKKPLKKFVWIPFVCMVFIMTFNLIPKVSFVTKVGTGKTGVVTTFGKLENYTLDSGIHLVKPWNKVTEIDTTVNEVSINTPAYTNDSQTVELVMTIQYRISTTDTFSVVRDNGIKRSQEVLEGKLESRITTVAKNIVATKKADYLLTNRSDLVTEIASQINGFSDEYYVIVSAVNLTDLEFTDEFEAAVAAKVAQQQAYEKALIEQQQALAAAENDKKIKTTEAEAAAEVAKIQANAEMEVVKIQADASEYQGRKEAMIALQRLASINGWSVEINEESGTARVVKADGTVPSDEELKLGTQRLIEYYYTESWNGILPDTYVGDGSVSSILIGGTN